MTNIHTLHVTMSAHEYAQNLASGLSVGTDTVLERGLDHIIDIPFSAFSRSALLRFAFQHHFTLDNDSSPVASDTFQLSSDLVKKASRIYDQDPTWVPIENLGNYCISSAGYFLATNSARVGV